MWVLYVCNGPKSSLDAKVCWWHSHSRAVYMAQCCQSIQLPQTPPWKPSLRSAKKKKKQEKNKKRQHYFLQKLTSRLKQGALFQYFKSRRCCQSTGDVFTFLYSRPPIRPSLGFTLSPFPPEQRGILSSSGSGRRKTSLLFLVVVSQANPGY